MIYGGIRIKEVREQHGHGFTARYGDRYYSEFSEYGYDKPIDKFEFAERAHKRLSRCACRVGRIHER